MNPPSPHPPRHARIPKQKRGPEGEPLCRWCEGPVPKGRRTFCSLACVDAALLVSHSGHARAAVYKRDRGVCAICGCDASKEYKAWKAHHAEAERLVRWFVNREVFGKVDWAEVKKLRSALSKRLVPNNPGWSPRRSTGWDMDHIVPVVKGGGSCGLENLRTLCSPCHRRCTARLAAERAAERNPKPAALSVQMPLL